MKIDVLVIYSSVGYHLEYTLVFRYGGGYQLGQLMNEVAGGFNTWSLLKEVLDNNILYRDVIGDVRGNVFL